MIWARWAGVMGVPMKWEIARILVVGTGGSGFCAEAPPSGVIAFFMPVAPYSSFGISRCTTRYPNCAPSGWRGAASADRDLKKRRTASDLAGGKVPGNRRPGECPRQQAREVYNRSAWPITRYYVLSLPGGVVLDQHDTADWLAADFGDVVFKPAVVAVGAYKLELLAVIK